MKVFVSFVAACLFSVVADIAMLAPMLRWIGSIATEFGLIAFLLAGVMAIVSLILPWSSLLGVIVYAEAENRRSKKVQPQVTAVLWSTKNVR